MYLNITNIKSLSAKQILLQIYSLLCVISQYQEYSAGRGTAAHDYEYRVSIPKILQRKEQWETERKVK